MIKRSKSPFLVLLVIAFLAACSSEQQRPLPELTFVHQPPIRLNVASLDVVSTYKAPGKPPHVEHLFRTSPEEALKRWAEARLRPLGRAESARYTVINAAVTEEPLAKTEGIAGAFKKEPSERYTATVEAQLEILNADGRLIQAASARATRSRSLTEGAEPAERERLWFDLLDSLMKDFDKEMEKAIRLYLDPWLL